MSPSSIFGTPTCHSTRKGVSKNNNIKRGSLLTIILSSDFRSVQGKITVLTPYNPQQETEAKTLGTAWKEP